MNPSTSSRHCLCGRAITSRGNRATRCAYCAKADPHRHAWRNKLPQMFVSCDSETMWSSEQGRQVMKTLSYGREDGTSASTTTGTETDMFNWLMNELSGVYTAPDGVEYKQATVAFHFNHDVAVLTNNLDYDDMFLIRKAQAKIRTGLCGSDHRRGPCEYERDDDTDGMLHRYDAGDISAVITDGMHSDLAAYHKPSGLAFAACPGQGLYVEHRPHGDRYEQWRRLTIRDTGRSFLGGLESVIQQWNPELDQEQREIITWGKSQRSGAFTGADLQRIAAYSEAECVGHARVCRKLLDALASAAHVLMRPNQLAGSGSIAAATMKHYGVPKRRQNHSDDRKIDGNATIDDLARLTYFGGLIEGPVVGLVTGVVREKDLNSAYPSQMIHLPCMRAGHGEWEISTAQDIPALEIGHALVTWDIRDYPTSTPPFTVRRKSGAVTQPLIGRRQWVSLAELQTAADQFPVYVHKTVAWRPDCTCEPPFFFLAELYNERQKTKTLMKTLKKGSVEWWEARCREQAIKLIINSIYGKLAQMKHGAGPYTNLHYASYITGATRAQVRRETWDQEAENATVVYQHTDSVLSSGGADPVHSDLLGAWGVEKSSHDFLIIQPGLALALGNDGKTASRGARVRDFTLAAWNWYSETTLTDPPATWPKLVVTQTLMTSRRQAIARGKPRLAGSFQTVTTELRVTSSKRDYANATRLPGCSTAWAVPPVVSVPDAVEGIEDIRIYQSQLDRRRKQGEFDNDRVLT